MTELSNDELERLSRCPPLNDFQRQKLEKDAKKNWDLFYKRNSNRFFKNRYWTKHEFQELFSDNKDTTNCRYLLEVGCGCGDFAIPLLGDYKCPSNDSATTQDLFVYCCDISDKAIEILKTDQVYIANDRRRIHAFVADFTQKDAHSQVLIETEGRLMDIVSLIFVLSAIDPNKMNQVIENVHRVLKPGGLVLFRDYAIYDKAMLRFGPNSKICDQFYVRQDGTRAFFFSKDQLLELFVKSGFQCQFIDYVRRETVNNANQDRFSRIFLQAKLRK